MLQAPYRITLDKEASCNFPKLVSTQTGADAGLQLNLRENLIRLFSKVLRKRRLRVSTAQRGVEEEK